ncbi:MAG: hypothetical protein ACNA8W_16325 [Bradymonadaceae bacterium]
MDRRHFFRLCAAIFVAFPLCLALMGCFGDEEEPGVPSLTFTSSVEAGHSHNLVLLLDEINDPPPTGLNRETSEASGHTHIVVLTDEDLNRIADGDTVTRVTTEVGGHTHTFTLRAP